MDISCCGQSKRTKKLIKLQKKYKTVLISEVVREKNKTACKPISSPLKEKKK